ncbi:MAG: hypothetical protein WC804_01970 [Sphingomonas sp.]|jgi:hypothetical protein|uniref:hypothetical protein n=1 Tax=Sphingomonas sp. TaxID=28214 RepID=UPI0035627F8E
MLHRREYHDFGAVAGLSSLRRDSIVARVALSGRAANAFVPARRGSFSWSMLDMARLFRALFPAVRRAVIAAVTRLFLEPDTSQQALGNETEKYAGPVTALFRSFFEPEQR